MAVFYCSWDDVKGVLFGLDVADLPASLQSRIDTQFIPTLKKEIDSYCRQNFDKTTVTEQYDGTGSDKILLSRRPVIEVTSCILRVIPSISWYTFKRFRNVNVVDSEGRAIAKQGGWEPNDPLAVPPFNSSNAVWEDGIEKADLIIDSAVGTLIIPPRILYLEMNAIPFWNYTFLRGNKNVEVTYSYGFEEASMPIDLRLAAAKLVACQVLQWKGISVGAGAQTINEDGVNRAFGGMPYQGLMDELKTQAYKTLDRYRRF